MNNNSVYRFYMMNFVSCRRMVSLFVYCGVTVLVTVNGQSTTDDDIDKDEINRLVDIVAELRSEQAKSKDAINSLKSQLAVSLGEIARLKNKGIITHLGNCKHNS